jgi:AcrR family transcriptional regulator
MEEVAVAARISLRTLYRLFASREALLRSLDRKPPASARERLLEEAFKLLGAQSLAQLSMDELAEAAEVSRATLYRFFPGKPALWKALVEAYSPWEPIAVVLAKAGDRAPRRLVPLIARALAKALEGRTGVLLRMVFEMDQGEPDTRRGIRRSMSVGVPDLIRYFGEQMAAGRMRRVQPVVALQLLVGPIFVHLATRRLAGMLGVAAPVDEVVQQIAEAWLRAMVPRSLS